MSTYMCQVSNGVFTQVMLPIQWLLYIETGLNLTNKFLISLSKMESSHPPKVAAKPTNIHKITLIRGWQNTPACPFWRTMSPGLVPRCPQLNCWQITRYSIHRRDYLWHILVSSKSPTVALPFCSCFGFTRKTQINKTSYRNCQHTHLQHSQDWHCSHRNANLNPHVTSALWILDTECRMMIYTSASNIHTV